MERSATDVALVEAARVIARGGELDRKLDALATQIRSAAKADAVLIYVLDPLAGTLVPAAVAGIDPPAAGQAGVIRLDDREALLARAVRERQAVTGAARSSPGQAYATATALPLVYVDEAGAEDGEGAVLVGYAAEAAASAADPESLAALADLCAVAIRQARLENTLRERAEWLGRVASSDALTGLPNRVTFERMLELELARATRQQTELSVVLFDIDGMAAINRDHGAHVGDDVLRATASLLADQVRLIDGVARIGADEFGLVAPGGGGAVAGRRIREAATRVSLPVGGPLSISAAAVVFPHDGANASELLARAEEVLSQAIQQGPGTVLGARETEA
jgi:diguanylate cyclase (GGDEF)-like protein